MKKLFCLLLMTFFAWMASAQEVEPSWENGKAGLKNFRTGQWAVKPTFNDARYLGSYEGKHYYGVKTVDNLWLRSLPGPDCRSTRRQYTGR